MNFLKNMINGNKQDQGDVNMEDVAALLEVAESEDGSGAEAFTEMAAIQSKLKGTQPEPAHFEEVEEDENATEEMVSDSSNGANGATPPETVANDNEVVMSPVMTKDDFDKLDDELARMSDELESQEPPVEAAEEPKREFVDSVGEGFEERVGVVETNTVDTEAGAVEVSVEPAEQPEPVAAEEPETASDESREFLSNLVTEIQGSDSVAEATPEVEKTHDVAADEGAAEAAEGSAPYIVEVPIPVPAAGRTGRRAGRVKTRLLGFEHASAQDPDPFEEKQETVASNQVNFPVGWIMIVDGPGFGTTFALFSGVSQIGRGEDQAIRLDFGDACISRQNHAALAYDEEQKKFFLGHSGKANLVRLNNNPVLSTEEIKNDDIIRIGETTLRFAALCNSDFNWDTKDKEDNSDAAIA